MKQQEATGSGRRQRQIKFAEAGLAFVFALAAVVLIGMKLTGGGDEATVAAVADPAPIVAQAEPAPQPEPVADEAPAYAEVADQPAALNPFVPDHMLYADGEAAYFAGDHAEAARLFAAYAERKPGNAWGPYMLGLALWKQGALEDAEDAFGRALEIMPDHQKSRVNLARVLLDQRRPADALPLVEAALESDPESVEAWRVLGRVYHNLGRADEAVDAYEQVLRRDDDDVWALNNLGLLHIEAERFADALAPLARAAQLAADEGRIRNNLGVALERTGHLRDAAEAYALAADAGHEIADASLERLAPLAEADTGERVDLAVLAASFAPGEVPGEADEAVAEAAEAEAPDTSVASVTE